MGNKLVTFTEQQLENYQVLKKNTHTKQNKILVNDKLKKPSEFNTGLHVLYT